MSLWNDCKVLVKELQKSLDDKVPLTEEQVKEVIQHLENTDDYLENEHFGVDD